MADQIVHPTSTIYSGSWITNTGGSSLYQAIDEENPSDDDYIQSR